MYGGKWQLWTNKPQNADQKAAYNNLTSEHGGQAKQRAFRANWLKDAYTEHMEEKRRRRIRRGRIQTLGTTQPPG